MKRRIFAFLMAMMMLISTVPAEVLATALDDGTGAEIYFIDDAIWLPEGEEPTAEVVETGEWVKTEETVTESRLVCPEAEHTHQYNCPVDEEGNYTCEAGEGHTHATDGCASDCAIAEHTHAEGCHQQTNLVKWVVALRDDASSLYAPGGWWGPGWGQTGNGTDLGWEYSKISVNQSGGFNLSDPTGAEHLGQYVTVTINGANSVEGVNGMKDDVLSADATGVVNIRTALGYYIDQIVLACYMPSYNDGTGREAPFNCKTVAGDDAYQYVLSDSTPTNVSIALKDLYTKANHESNVDDYFLMIQIAPLPAPVYVGYDSGAAGGHDIAARPVSETGNIEYTSGSESYTATPVENYPTWSYPTSAATHSALSISPEAEAEANSHGYSFAGWQLEYYTKYAESGNNFSGEMTVGGANLFKGTPITLTVHAKLTAIWQPMDHITVSKVWNDSNDQDGIRPDSVVVHLLRNGVHNGTPVTLSAENNWTAEWTVPAADENGNAIQWNVEEVVPAGYTYNVSGDAEAGFIVTNTHVVERTSTYVQKVWNDDNDRDGIRPYGVQVQLFCNGEKITTYTDASGKENSGVAVLTEAGSWSHEWQGLLKNNVGGVGAKNVYTVKEIGYVDENGDEIENPGYVVVEGEDAETGVLLITNTWKSTTMDIPVEKKWNDADNQDNLRPSSVTVTLTANGESTGKTLVLDAANGWKGKFEDVYVNEDGSSIYYSLIENEVAGYSMSLSGNATDGFVVTNSHTPETTSVPVSKVWVDGDNQDGIRPGEIVVTLQKKNGEEWVNVDTLKLNAANNWNGTFAGVPKYEAGSVGKLVEYRVQELNVPTGYTASYEGNVITNTHTPETANLNVQKVWDDANDQDGIRVPAVIVTLYINGQATENTVTLNAENGWKSVWENMPRYHEGQRISYSIVETGYIDKDGTTHEGVPTGYTVDHSYENAGTKEPNAVVTNIHAPATTDLNVQKIWDDDDNRAGLRPESITVTLWHNAGGKWSAVTDAEGNPVTRTLNKDNEWDETFIGLPMYSGGEKIVYNVVEDALDPALGYDDPAYSIDDELRVMTVTNSRPDEKVSVVVTKKWTDDGNRDAIRPESVEVTLFANGIDAKVSKELSAANGWTATFDNLYKHYNGKEVAYSVVETAVAGYTTEYTVSTDAAGNFTVQVENIHVPETISIPVSKTWDDGDDRDGLRPHTVKLKLQKKVNGFWEDVENAELVLEESGNWKGSFNNLPKYQTGVVGQVIEYRVFEEPVNGYNGNSSTTALVENGSAVIVNTHTPETKTVTAEKIWNDTDNQDGLRPASITLHLMKNGDHIGEAYKIVLDGTPDQNGESEAWVASWTDLFKYEEGKEINYTVYEEVTDQMKADGYSVAYEQSGDIHKITNTRNVNKTTFTVQKIWADANNQDNVRYAGVAVQLYANGSAIGEPVVLNSDGHWRYTWSDLNANAAGRKITYTVAELYYLDKDNTHIELTETLYTEGQPVADEHTGITTITNTHEVEKTSVTVKKEWIDDNNRDHVRPDSVTVELYRNGEPTAVTAVLNETNEWTYQFTNLDVHHGIGVDNIYTVVEIGHSEKDIDGQDAYTDTIPEHYSVTYETAADGTLIVKNTHAIETVSIPVTKVWEDGNDQDGIRPEAVVVELKGSDDSARTMTISAADNWQGIFENLPKYQAGVEIQYTLQEVGHYDEIGDAQVNTVPENYTVAVSGDFKTGFTVTNTHEPDVTTVYARKEWNDNVGDGKRPASITLHLLANGEHMGTDYVKTLNVANDETTAQWTNLPMNKAGIAIIYTVREEITSEMTNNGYSVSYSEDAAGVQVVTNTRAADKVTFVAKKVWDDGNNKDGSRPYAVVLELYKDDVATGQLKTVTAEDDWTVMWIELDENDAEGKIKYTAKEIGYFEKKADLDKPELMKEGVPESYSVSYPNAESVTSGIYQITNSRVTDKIEVSVVKVWSDANDQDGKRTDSVTVELYLNNQPTGKTAELNADNNWSVTFEQLEKNFVLNVPNVYTVVEAEAPDGYEATYTSVKDDATGNFELTVTNTHTPELVSVPVMKVWSDANDQDGIRPDSVTVTLYANGEAVATKTLDATMNWRGAFDNQPKFEDGKLITYTVGEATNDVPDGYAATVDGYTITNTHTPAVTSMTATKVWDDNNNQDGKRPEEITLHLLANGVHTEKKIVLDGEVDEYGESEAWVATWSNLPKFEEGKEINYTVYEQEVGNGYVSSNKRIGNEVTITNTRAVEKTSFTIQKIWRDTNNQDNVRYPGVAIQLYANGKAYGDPMVLNAAGSWQYTWSGLDVNSAGQKIAYTAEEVYYLDKDNNKVDVSEESLYNEGTPATDSHTGVTTITNTHEVEKIDVVVVKDWNDADDQDGIRPVSIVVELYRNGQPTGQTRELTADKWTAKFENLDVHHGIGVENVYSVVETGYRMTDDGKLNPGVPAGYNASYEVGENGELTIKNSHTPETVDIPVTKYWEDADNQDGIRPSEITVTLQKKDGAAWVDVTTLKLNVDNNWSHSFTGMPKYKPGATGELVEYRVQELSVPGGYEVSYEGNVITNTHTPKILNLYVQKDWADANNQDGKRPYAIELTLYVNGQPAKQFFGDSFMQSLTLSETQNWKGVWTGLPQYHNGQRISYTVVETGYVETEGKPVTTGIPVGYTVTHAYKSVDNAGNAYATVTNSYTPELTDLNVQKVWNDDDNRAGLRPESVTVELYSNGRKTGQTAVLSPANEWDYTFLGIPRYENGVEVLYEVQELSLDGSLNYKVSYNYDRVTRIATITNTRVADKVSISVVKKWVDENDQDGMRPDEVIVTLLANGIETGETRILKASDTASENWTATFENLYKHYMGKEVTYTVVETTVEGYTGTTECVDGKIVITNTHTPEKIDIPVTKIWDDADNQDGIRPDSIEVTLYADDVSTGKTAVITMDNNWMDTESFTNLDKYADGQEINYTVVETAVTGYEATTAVNNGAITVTNHHEPEQTEVVVTKVWDDDNNRDGKRPESITVHLLKNGDHTQKSVELTDAMDWTYTWKELPKFENGQEIVYTVYEEIHATAIAEAGVSGQAINDYIPGYTHDSSNWNNITITNYYQPELTEINVMKVWDDSGDRDGLRPDSVEVKLLADGDDTGMKLTLNAQNEWTGEWNELFKYRDNGTEIVYTVEEVAVPQGYDVKVVRDTEFADDMFIITNKHDPATTGVSVQKLWDDENDNDGKRPDGIIVQLYANGSAVEGATVLLSEMNYWSYIWHQVDGKPLYVFDKGEEISYYVDEIGYVIDGEEYDNVPEGYDKKLVTDSYFTTITNTHLTEKTAVSVEKVWVDSQNNDGLRPTAVSVTLYNNGQLVETVELNEANGWKHVWNGLYKYVSGTEAVYTVVESPVAEYTTSYKTTTGTDGSVYWTVTNTHEIKTKEMTISKVWVDQSNTEKYRPDYVNVQLYKNGNAYGSVITLSVGNGWKYPVILPVYENGEQIIWTIAEINIPKYYSASYNQSTLTVTNTIQSKEIPKTGDDSHLSVWMGMMMLSCAGIAVLLVGDRKRKMIK